MSRQPTVKSPPANLSALRDALGFNALLTVGEVAAILGTTERFPRRLIEERRITYVKLERGHVRIPDTALADYIRANVVRPRTARAARLEVVA